MNSPTAFTKAPNEWMPNEHNMCSRRAACTPLWWRSCFSCFITVPQFTTCSCTLYISVSVLIFATCKFILSQTCYVEIISIAKSQLQQEKHNKKPSIGGAQCSQSPVTREALVQWYSLRSVRQLQLCHIPVPRILSFYRHCRGVERCICIAAWSALIAMPPRHENLPSMT